MANTTRQNIISTLEDTLESIASVNDVKLADFNASDVIKLATNVQDTESLRDPVVFISVGQETKADGVVGRETWLWTVFLVVLTSSSEREEIASDIHAAMYSDNDVGGYAISSHRTAMDLFDFEGHSLIKGLIMTYEIRYSHTIGVM